MRVKPLPSQDDLRQLLDYDSLTGELRWKARTPDMFDDSPTRDAAWKCKIWNSKHAGRVAGHIGSKRYRIVSLNGTHYFVHRLCWKWWYGTDPIEVDHQNGYRADNRISNLQSVDSYGNAINKGLRRDNTSGVNGVFFDKRERKWRVAVGVAGRHHCLGYFDSFTEAVAARRKADIEFGFSPNHGKRRA